MCDYLVISVLTPYYKEDVLYSDEELNKDNEDGISILFYLQTIYHGMNYDTSYNINTLYYDFLNPN